MLPNLFTFDQLIDAFKGQAVNSLKLKPRNQSKLEHIHKALQWTVYYQKWVYLFFICYLKKNTIKTKLEQLKKHCKIFQSSLPR